MTRGNQRDVDRARAAARDSGKGEAKAGNPLQRQVSFEIKSTTKLFTVH